MGLQLDARVDALGFQLFDVRIDPELIHGAQGFGADLQRDKIAQLRNKHPFLLDVRDKAPLGLPVGVGDMIARNGSFSGKWTDLGHVVVCYKSRA